MPLWVRHDGYETLGHREYSRTAAATGNSVAAKARRSDPVTSHQAAQSVQNISYTHRDILRTLQLHGPMHDQLLIESILSRYGRISSEAGIRSRRAELVTKGLVRDSGQRVKLPSGRQSIVWEAT